MLLWAAQWISAAGDTFSFLALAIRVDSFFTDAGDSARALGMVLIAYALPVLLFMNSLPLSPGWTMRLAKLKGPFHFIPLSSLKNQQGP